MLPFEVAGVDLSKQKLTLPMEDLANPGKVLEIKRPQLDAFEHSDFFWADEMGVHFRARCDGFTTSGSSYPRSELREMADTEGKVLAAWSSNSGEHTLWMRFKVLEAPP